MKRMKKLMAVFAIAFAALSMVLALPMVAAAERVDLEGRGVLMARGTGKAVIEGKLDFRGQARAAVLIVEDKAGDAKVEVRGYKKRVDEGNGKTRYVGFNGRPLIQGSNVAIDLQGKEIQFAVRGEGKATLKGKGMYRVNGGRVMQWTANGASVDFHEEATVPSGNAQ